MSSRLLAFSAFSIYVITTLAIVCLLPNSAHSQPQCDRFAGCVVNHFNFTGQASQLRAISNQWAAANPHIQLIGVHGLPDGKVMVPLAKLHEYGLSTAEIVRLRTEMPPHGWPVELQHRHAIVEIDDLLNWSHTTDTLAKTRVAYPNRVNVLSVCNSAVGDFGGQTAIDKVFQLTNTDTLGFRGALRPGRLVVHVNEQTIARYGEAWLERMCNQGFITHLGDMAGYAYTDKAYSVAIQRGAMGSLGERTDLLTMAQFRNMLNVSDVGIEGAMGARGAFAPALMGEIPQLHLPNPATLAREMSLPRFRFRPTVRIPTGGAGAIAGSIMAWGIVDTAAIAAGDMWIQYEEQRMRWEHTEKPIVIQQIYDRAATRAAWDDHIRQQAEQAAREAEQPAIEAELRALGVRYVD